MSETFYWHDYETWGADTRRDRPCQFAGLRTDADFNPVAAPDCFFCRPPRDQLPHPDACLITGITPQRAETEGLCEADFAARVESLLGAPGTCGVGYNSIRFDDEITRNLLYRNLRDPYAREWRNGNSRWDLIDTLRLAHALRPEGIAWPTRDDGTASFRLEDLTAANGIPHAGAHDALADVRATLALARLLKQAQPKLLDYALALRDKQRVRTLLGEGRPLVHASARFPAALGCIAPVMPVAPHPVNGNGVICFDLREDPALLLDLGVEEIRARLFTPADQLPEGVARIPLKTIHVNRAPVIAPMGTLTPQAAGRWQIDLDRVDAGARFVRAHAPELRERVQAVHASPAWPEESDPDLMLYSGGFLGDGDRGILARLLQASPETLAGEAPRFADARLAEMLFRYRARNWPRTLTPEEQEDWDAFRFTRLTDPDGGASIVLEAYEQRLAELAEARAGDPAAEPVIAALAEWAELLMDGG